MVSSNCTVAKSLQYVLISYSYFSRARKTSCLDQPMLVLLLFLRCFISLQYLLFGITVVGSHRAIATYLAFCHSTTQHSTARIFRAQKPRRGKPVPWIQRQGRQNPCFRQLQPLTRRRHPSPGGIVGPGDRRRRRPVGVRMFPLQPSMATTRTGTPAKSAAAGIFRFPRSPILHS